MKVRIAVRGSVGALLMGTIKKRTRVMSTLIATMWQKEVGKSFLSPRAKARYIRAIVPYKTRPGAEVRDPIVRLLEYGWQSFDMKPGLLKGKEKRVIPLLLPGKASPTFRTISSKSPSSSWIHPGFSGVKVVEKLRTKLTQLIGEAIK